MKVCIGCVLGRAQGPDHTEAIVADSLIKHGFDVCFATNCKVDVVKHFHNNFGICLPSETRVYGVLPSSLATYPSFAPVWVWTSLKRAIKKEKPDVVFCDGVPYRVKAPGRSKPTVAVYFSEPIAGEVARAHAKFGKQPLYSRIYSIVFERLQQMVSSKNIDIIIANSKAGAAFYEKVFKKSVHILPSPVDTAKFSPGKKEDLVTHVGIFDPRKKIESVIEGVALARTKPKLSLVGNLIPTKKWYLDFLRSKVKKLGMEDRVSFHVNASFSELCGIVSRSKICVSAGVEYFSLAIIEQMAAGCVPIVSRSFVPWFEIVDKGKYGFGFDTVEELACTIDKVLTNQELYNTMQRVAIKRAKEFDVKVFGNRLVDIISN